MAEFVRTPPFSIQGRTLDARRLLIRAHINEAQGCLNIPCRALETGGEFDIGDLVTAAADPPAPIRQALNQQSRQSRIRLVTGGIAKTNCRLGKGATERIQRVAQRLGASATRLREFVSSRRRNE